MLELARMVQAAGRKMDLHVEIDHLPDPRVEAEEHYYNARHSKLVELGLKPHLLSESLLDSLLNIAMRYQDRIDRSLFLPKVNWRSAHNDRRPKAGGGRQRVFRSAVRDQRGGCQGQRPSDTGRVGERR